MEGRLADANAARLRQGHAEAASRAERAHADSAHLREELQARARAPCVMLACHGPAYHAFVFVSHCSVAVALAMLSHGSAVRLHAHATLPTPLHATRAQPTSWGLLRRLRFVCELTGTWCLIRRRRPRRRRRSARSRPRRRTRSRRSRSWELRRRRSGSRRASRHGCCDPSSSDLWWCQHAPSQWLQDDRHAPHGCLGQN